MSRNLQVGNARRARTEFSEVDVVIRADDLAGKTMCPLGTIHARYCTDADRAWVKAAAKRLRRRPR